MVIESPPGSHPEPRAEPGIDCYALTHNETSTGVAMPIRRVSGADPDALVLVDATSGAGGLPVSADEFDAYYFAPQKCFGSDGGLWIALLSPAALARTARVTASNRYIPEFLSLQVAIDNSRLAADLQHPGRGHVAAAGRPGGLDTRSGRPGRGPSSGPRNRRRSCTAGPSGCRSPPRSWPTRSSDRRWSGTIDFADSIDAAALSATLRRNGIVDTDSYRKLGRNQLRIGMFPAVDPADVQALTACIDYVIERS